MLRFFKFHLTLHCTTTPQKKQATQRQHNWLNSTKDKAPLKQIMNEAPTTTRLKSRRPFYSTQINHFNLQKKWKQEWQEDILTGGDLVEDPTNLQPLINKKTMNNRQQNPNKTWQNSRKFTPLGL